MASLVILPTEILENIAGRLLAADAARLATTCRFVYERLGDRNQYFWYTQLPKGNKATVSASSSSESSDSGDEAENSDKDVEVERFDFRKDYRAEALSIIRGQSQEDRCVRCLEPQENQNIKIRIVSLRLRQNIRYCHHCSGDFYITSKAFESICPDILIPPTVVVKRIRAVASEKKTTIDDCLLKTDAVSLLKEKAAEGLPGWPYTSFRDWTQRLNRHHGMNIGYLADCLFDAFMEQVVQFYNRFTVIFAMVGMENLQVVVQEMFAVEFCMFVVESIGQRASTLTQTSRNYAHNIASAIMGPGDGGEFKFVDLKRPECLLYWLDIWHRDSHEFIAENGFMHGPEVTKMHCCWCKEEDPSDNTVFQRYQDGGKAEDWIAVHMIESHPDELMMPWTLVPSEA